ncbi:hypothetical protein Csa_023799, partial [Cucumis sativus]
SSIFNQPPSTASRISLISRRLSQDWGNFNTACSLAKI